MAHRTGMYWVDMVATGLDRKGLTRNDYTPRLRPVAEPWNRSLKLSDSAWFFSGPRSETCPDLEGIESIQQDR